MSGPRVLVTGATGFIGRSVVGRLVADGRYEPVAAVRRRDPRVPASVATHVVEGLAATTDWTLALEGVETVVHAAARVHVLSGEVHDALGAYRAVNVDGTVGLARQAAARGVRRLIFLSSIKVNGESTDGRGPFVEEDVPAPTDPYGVSKAEAEAGLELVAAETGLEVVVIRPPLVYGPGVGANFKRMMGWLARGVPLPLGGIRNRRSLVALDNLVDLVVTCMTHPAAVGRPLLVCDGEDLSTPELLRRTATALGRRARLLRVPAGLLRVVGLVTGQRAAMSRLCSSLQVSAAATRRRLGWTAPLSVDEGLALAAEGFLAGGAP